MEQPDRTRVLKKTDLLGTYDGSPLKWLEWSSLFKELIHDTSSSPNEKLAILKSKTEACIGIIQKIGGGEHAYKEALTSLKQFCGDRDAITSAHLKSIDSIHPGKTLDDLIKFAHTVRSHLFELSQIDNFPRPEVITTICDKLKYSYSFLVLDWKETQPSRTVDLNSFGSWLCMKVNNLRCVAGYQSSSTKSTRIYQTSATTLNHEGQRCLLCSESHRIEGCRQFMALKINDRYKFLKDNSVCFNCLKQGHRSGICTLERQCPIDNCGKKHHTLLHKHIKSNRNTSTSKDVKTHFARSADRQERS